MITVCIGQGKIMEFADFYPQEPLPTQTCWNGVEPLLTEVTDTAIHVTNPQIWIVQLTTAMLKVMLQEKLLCKYKNRAGKLYIDLRIIWFICENEKHTKTNYGKIMFGCKCKLEF